MQDKDEFTALHRAVLCQDLALIKKLLSSQIVDINAQDIDGDTPLHIACRLCNYKIMTTLVDHWADVNIRNKNRRKPSSYILFRNIKMDYLKYIKQRNLESNTLSHDLACYERD